MGTNLIPDMPVDIYVKKDDNAAFPPNPVTSTFPDEMGNVPITYIGEYEKGRYDLLVDANQNSLVDNADIYNNPTLETYAFQASIQGDLNGDRKIDIKDIYLVAKAFATEPGDERWDPRADLDEDDYIGIKDIFVVAKDFGKTY